MATIAELLVKIGASSKELEKALSQAQSKSESFAAKAQRVIGGAIKAAFAAATVAVAAFTAGLANAASQMAELRNIAAKANLEFGQFQKLAFSAKSAGLNVEQVVDAVAELTKKITEADLLGSGSAVDALKIMGLEASKLKNMAPEKQFEIIVAKLAKIKDAGQRAFLADELFSGEGVMIMQKYLQNLGGDVTKTDDRFKKLGLNISKGQVDAIEKAQTAWSQLGSVVDGLFQHLASKLAPGVEMFIQKTLKWVEEMGGAGAIANTIFEYMQIGFTAVGKVIDFAKLSFSGLTMIIKSMAPAVDVVKMAFEGWKLLIDKLKPIFSATMGYIFGGIKKVTDGVSGLFDSIIPAAKAAFEYMGPAIQKIIGWLNIAIDKIILAIEKLEKMRQKATTAVLDQFMENDFNAASSLAGTGAGLASAGIIAGTQNTVKLELVADKEGLVKAVISDEELQNQINAVAKRTMQNSARSTRR